MSLLLGELDGVSLQLNILTPLRLAWVGEEEAALGQVLLLLPRVHCTELITLLLRELLDMLLDNLLLTLHKWGHGPALGRPQNARLLHGPCRLLLLLAPVTRILYDWLPRLLLLYCRPDKLSTVLLLPSCHLGPALLLLQSQLLLVWLQNSGMGQWSHSSLLAVHHLPMTHGLHESHLARLLSHFHLLSVAHGLVHLRGHGLPVTHGLHRHHVRQGNLLTSHHSLDVTQVLWALPNLLSMSKACRLP